MQNSCDGKTIKQRSPYNQYTFERQAEACRVFVEDWDEYLENLLVIDREQSKHLKPKELE